MFTGRRYIKWSENDTRIISEYFKEYFLGDRDGIKGSLPSKSGCVLIFFLALNAFIEY